MDFDLDKIQVRDVINAMFIYAVRPGEVYTLNLTPEEVNECALKKKGDIRQDEMMNVKGILEQIVFMVKFRYRHDGCSIIEVLREDKYSVKKDKLPISPYPPYVSGTSYMLPYDVTPDMLDIAESLPYRPVDDAFMTGFMRVNWI
ncbi:hypothetical protein CHS0354_039042 [Potamilus streckersoni]|uniref:Uncharacterized protein n=1 Tax=Potamilus streckersoni TaxID=2493646 RepID=A0AAE0RS54_9BIVA|nr:hypothetical protein CHS0354_039042 [Potamilus streckersoni]